MLFIALLNLSLVVLKYIYLKKKEDSFHKNNNTSQHTIYVADGVI